MHRVRIGIIGLASVFLLVLLAAALYSLFGDKPAARGAPSAPPMVANMSEPPREPLAELGVAPGNSQPDANSAAATPPPPALRTGSSTPAH